MFPYKDLHVGGIHAVKCGTVWGQHLWRKESKRVGQREKQNLLDVGLDLGELTPSREV